MEKNDILAIMMTQHALIETLFFAFKDDINENPEKAKGFLSEFEWESKKHFFVEEEAIFNFLPWNDAEISSMITRIKNEHTIMLGRLSEMLKNFEILDIKAVEGFYVLLKNHRDVEEEKLYPLLDKKLLNSQKNRIVARIGQISMIEHK